MFPCEYKPKGNKLGEGSFGEVNIVEKKDGSEYVFKKIKKDKRLKNISYFYDPIELDIIFRINSPYLVRGVDITTKNECTEEVGVVMKYIEGDLFKDLYVLSDHQKKKIMYDIVMAVKCLHDNNYLHLDIKPENMMYNKNVDGKPQGILIDYGLASYVPEGVSKGIKTTQPRITFDYSSPRAAIQLTHKKEVYDYNDKDDIWSVGIAFLNFYMDIYDYIDSKGIKEHRDYKKLYNLYMEKFSSGFIDEFLETRVLNLIKKFTPKEKEEFKDLLRNLLHTNPEKRYNINQVVAHPFFKEFRTTQSKCMTMKPSNYDLSKVPSKYFEGVKEIPSICMKYIPYQRLQVLFMAVDIYLRVLAQAQENVLEKIHHGLPYLCVLIAHKYFAWSENDDDFVQNIYAVSEYETVVYKTIRGLINEERYYNQFSNLQEAQKFYNMYIKDTKNIDKYLNNLPIVKMRGNGKIGKAKIEDLKL